MTGAASCSSTRRATPTGVADKRAVHHADTPLHLAFSCYVFDADGRLLVTRRALAKPTFPGVWTNSCCGHPAPGSRSTEAVVAACGRSSASALRDLRLVLPAFRYRAVMDYGVIENEMCPVFVATSGDDVRADPDEVEDHRWEPWPEFRDVRAGRPRGLVVVPRAGRRAARGPRVRAGRPRSELPPAAR